MGHYLSLAFLHCFLSFLVITLSSDAFDRFYRKPSAENGNHTQKKALMRIEGKINIA